MPEPWANPRTRIAGAAAETTPAHSAEQFAVNVTAAAELTRLLLPALRAAGGTVVFVNSGSGLNARAPLATYAASKFALRAYADALRSEEPQLRMSTVYPGRTSTGVQREVRAAEAGEYDENDYLRPETVAGVLASVLALPADGLICDLTLRPFSLRTSCPPALPRSAPSPTSRPVSSRLRRPGARRHRAAAAA